MKRAILMMSAVFAATATANEGFAAELLLRLGPRKSVQADSLDIHVPGYSVPSFVDWDNDGLNDLVVGQGGGSYPAKVRVYINEGADSRPQFSNFLFAQSNGSDLTCPGEGCLGCFPRVVYWDADSCKDLLIGRVDGKVEIFLNVATDDNPTFDGGTLLQVGPPGSKADISLAGRATPAVVDWNNDGAKDLLVGERYGRIYIYLNEGTDTEPDFRSVAFARENSSDLIVPSQRSSPVVMDLDGDGKKDILTGNTAGQLLFYSNTGTDADPKFSGYDLVEADGVAIDLPDSPRSRPSVCDWTSDGYFDVLIGAEDGKVHLYQSIPQPGDMDNDYDVDMDDFAIFALYWGASGCGDCAGADLIDDDIVDMLDVAEFTFWWLEGADN